MFERLVIRLLAFFLIPLLLPAQPSARTKDSSLPMGGNLGRVWRVRDWMRPTYDFKGAWVRRANSLVFDLDYTDTMKGKQGRKANDVIQLISIKGDQVALRVASTDRTYLGTIQLDGKTIRGRGDWCRGIEACGWEAVADWEVDDQLLARISGKPRYTGPSATKSNPTGQADLGTVWRVRDNTNTGYSYSGLWTFQPNGRIRFEYKDNSTGQSASGSLEFVDSVGDKVTIFNPGRRKHYRGTIQPGGKSIRGTADWCQSRSACFWEATIEK